jgi:hypothetical protein
MHAPRFHATNWLIGYSGWALYCAIISLFGLTGYYADLFRKFLPDWLGVGLLIAPLAVIVFIQWEELPDRTVAIAHSAAASWFMLLALGMEAGHLLGYVPKGTILYRVLAHLGWTFAWAGIYRRARASRRKDGSSGSAPPA